MDSQNVKQNIKCVSFVMKLKGLLGYVTLVKQAVRQ